MLEIETPKLAIPGANQLRSAPVRRILAELWLGAERPGVERGAAELSQRLAETWPSERLLPPVAIADNAPPGAETQLHRRDLLEIQLGQVHAVPIEPIH